MNPTPRHSLPASAVLVALCALNAPRVLAQAPADAPPPPADQSATEPAAELSPYEKAVRDYCDAAGKQLDAYRLKIDAALKKDPKSAAWTAAQAKLAESAALLAKLKDATQPQFDTVKAQFEKPLGELIRLVAAAEKP